MARIGTRVRHALSDPASGLQTLTIRDDTGDTTEPHGLSQGEAVKEVWQITPDDTSSARAVIRWTQRLSRGDWQVRRLVEIRMTGSETRFRMIARLTAWEGDRQVLQRDWSETVPRRFV